MANFITDSEYYKGRVDIRDFILFIDEPKESGGTDKAPTPSEYLLAALASCMGITMKMYADRKKWNTGKIRVECSYREDKSGERYIHKMIEIENTLSDDQEKRLAFIGAKCPVSKMLNVPMETEIV